MKNGVINPKQKYFTQCMVQMGVTGLCRTCFVVWTPHGHLIDEVKFDESLWGGGGGSKGEDVDVLQ